MALGLPKLGQLQRKVLWVISVIVIVPMLVAGWLASEWVSKSFEERLEQWITDAARANQSWLKAYQSDAVMLGRVLADDRRYLRSIEYQPDQSMPAPVRRISQELGVNLVQLYTADRRLLYSSLPIEMQALGGRPTDALYEIRKQLRLNYIRRIAPRPEEVRHFLEKQVPPFGTREARTCLPKICACLLIAPPHLRRGISRGRRHPAYGSRRGFRPVQK